MTARLVFNPRHASSNLSFFLRPFFLFFSFSIFLLPVFSKRLLLLVLRARSISWEIREIINHCIRSQSFSEITRHSNPFVKNNINDFMILPLSRVPCFLWEQRKWYTWFVKGNRPISNNLSFSQYGMFWRYVLTYIEQKSLCKIICLPDIIKNKNLKKKEKRRKFFQKNLLLLERFLIWK